MRQSRLESRSVCLYLPSVFLPADAVDSSAFATKPDRLNADVCRRAAPGKEASAIHTMPFSLYYYRLSLLADFSQQTSRARRATLRVVLWKKITSATAKGKARLHCSSVLVPPSLTDPLDPYTSSGGAGHRYGAVSDWNWPTDDH